MTDFSIHEEERYTFWSSQRTFEILHSNSKSIQLLIRTDH